MMTWRGEHDIRGNDDPNGRRLYTGTQVDGNRCCGSETSASQYIHVLANDMECSFVSVPLLLCGTSGNTLERTSQWWHSTITATRWEMNHYDGFITGGQSTPTVTFTAGYTTQHFSVTVTDSNGCSEV
ncbi:MAG: hypothetical protein R2795_09420 [Saprospiraceae bacterium]